MMVGQREEVLALEDLLTEYWDQKSPAGLSRSIGKTVSFLFPLA